MGLRRGFFFGFLAGAAAATAMGRAERVEAPAEVGETRAAKPALPLGESLERLRRQADQALAAAREAAEEKEAELRRRFAELSGRR